MDDYALYEHCPHQTVTTCVARMGTKVQPRQRSAGRRIEIEIQSTASLNFFFSLISCSLLLLSGSRLLYFDGPTKTFYF